MKLWNYLIKSQDYISGYLSSDSRDIENAYETGKAEGIRTLKAYVYRIVKYIGAYVAAMNGVDAICFTAGVGENSGLTRSLICDKLGYLGVTLDEELNQIRGENLIISTKSSKIKIMVIPTNEELAIARETVELVK